MYELVEKLDNLKSTLIKLNKKKFSEVKMKAEEVMKELKAWKFSKIQGMKNY